MTSQHRSVAMLATNSAFAAILCRALEEDGRKVPHFSDAGALTTFMRIAPVDVVILDGDLEGPPAADIARGLRNHAALVNRLFHIIVLTRADRPFQQQILAAGADAVIQKPSNPTQVLDCIEGLYAGHQRRTASLGIAPARPLIQRTPPATSAPIGRSAKIIPLFGEGRRPR